MCSEVDNDNQLDYPGGQLDGTVKHGIHDSIQRVKTSSCVILESLYNDNDVEKWQKGAQLYRQFINAIPREKQRNLQGKNLGELQALFLGEKPALFSATSVARQLETELRAFGIESVGAYSYSPEAVQTVLQTFPDDFKDLPTDSPQAFMSFLAAQDAKSYGLQRGLILGFPRPSIEQFLHVESLQVQKLALSLLEIFGEGTKDYNYLVDSFFGKRQDKHAITSFMHQNLLIHSTRLGISIGDIPRLMDELRYVLSARSVNVHGVSWVDHDVSAESTHLQQRLIAAFDRSEILGSPQSVFKN